MQSASSLPVIEITDIRFQYPASDFALAVDTFQAAAAESVAIVGPSGCGKTTLLQIAAGIIAPGAGTVAIDGEDLTAMTRREQTTFRLQKIGLVFQEFEMVEHLTVRDNILLPLHLGSPADGMRQRAHDLAEAMGIARHLNKGPRKLSQGERQRVAICRALVIQPRLLLADEPTGNLDPDNKRAALELLIQQARERQCPLLVATHDHDLLPAFDRVVDFANLNPATTT